MLVRADWDSGSWCEHFHGDHLRGLGLCSTLSYGLLSSRFDGLIFLCQRHLYCFNRFLSGSWFPPEQFLYLIVIMLPEDSSAFLLLEQQVVSCRKVIKPIPLDFIDDFGSV